MPILVSWGNESLPGSFRNLGTVSPTTFQAGASQLDRGALCSLHPASRTLGPRRAAVGGLVPFQKESGMPVYIYLPPSFGAISEGGKKKHDLK